MSKIRQALQLLADSGLSTRQVAAALGISKTTVSEIALYARTAGIDWPLASTLSDEELQRRLYPPPRPRSSHRQEPDYAQLHQGFSDFRCILVRFERTSVSEVQ